MSKISQASAALQDLIWLIERRQIVLWMSDDARREILAMLRFYLYAVTKGVTPEASALAALEFVASIQQLQSRGVITPSPPPQNS
jgi:hypothetical protein